MYIAEIHIYGYGKLERVSLTNLSGLTVFYGENEAGKTTLMSFIHSILFGFPSKQQSELRYEPKTGAVYGGKLIVITSEQGSVTIERVAGKSAGQVTVLFEDGVVGGEAELQTLLHRMDKSLYQSIFSFNLQGLQNIHQLKKEELGRFLFSTGAVGTDRLLAVENKLQKELDGRFKPSGKKPILNEKISQTKAIASELKKAEVANEDYWRLRHHFEQTQVDLATISEEEKTLLTRIQKWEEWKKLEPLVMEQKHLTYKLANLEEAPFPLDGVRRLQDIETRLVPILAEKTILSERLRKLEIQQQDQTPNQLVLEKQHEIMEAIEKLPLIESLTGELEAQKQKLTTHHQQLAVYEEKLHLSSASYDLNEIDTSLFMKERVRQTSDLQRKLSEKKAQLDERYEREKQGLERLEERVATLEGERMPADRQAELEELLSASQQHVSSALSERSLLESQKQWLLLTQSEDKKRQRQARTQSILGFVFSLLLITLGVLQNQTLLTIVGLGLFVFSGWLIFSAKRQKKDASYNAELERIKSKETSLSYHQDIPERDVTLAKSELSYAKQKEEDYRLTKLKWEQQNEQFERVLTEYERWEQEKLTCDRQLTQLGNSLHLPHQVAMSFLLEAFELLEAMKAEKRQADHLVNEINQKNEQIMRMNEDLTEFGRLFFNPLPPAKRLGEFLRKLVHDQLQKEARGSEIVVKLEETKEQLERLDHQIQHLNKERQDLFKIANVSTLEDYLRQSELAIKREQLTAKLTDVEKQVSFTSLSVEEIREFQGLDRSHEVMAHLQERLAQVQTQKEQWQQALSDLKHQISLLEEGGTYTDLLHRYTEAQSELDHEAKEWARFALARDILRRTMDVFNKERLPNVLSRAEEYLAELTDDRYIRMIPNDRGNGFFIHRKDDMVFEANELSQATMEQVYVALRLALISSIYEKHQLPIIIDDSFVNFDATRTKKVISLLKKWPHNQVLFFTCHEHLLNHFAEETVISLQNVKPVLK